MSSFPSITYRRDCLFSTVFSYLLCHRLRTTGVWFVSAFCRVPLIYVMFLCQYHPVFFFYKFLLDYSCMTMLCLLVPYCFDYCSFVVLLLTLKKKFNQKFLLRWSLKWSGHNKRTTLKAASYREVMDSLEKVLAWIKITCIYLKFH